MTVYEVLTYIVLGIILGAVGQSIRSLVGIKKASDEASFSQKEFKDWFDFKALFLSLIIGGAAGSLGAISLLGTQIDKQFLLTIVAAGYAGADFIEGFIRTNLPK
jgi:H+/Cl- antiporter ClcA